MSATTSSAWCDICQIAVSSVGHYFGASAACDSCRTFFKKYYDVDHEDLKSPETCTGACAVSDRKCRKCRMDACRKSGMDITKGKIFKIAEKTTEKTPKQKSKIAQKDSSGSAKKSKLSLKGTKSQKNAAGSKGTLDTWTQSGDGETGDESIDPAADTAEDQEDLKVPCVASLHNLGNTCFLNSVVQVLRYTPQFEEKLRELAKQVKLSSKERHLVAQLDQIDDPEENEEDYATWDVVRHLNGVFTKMNNAEERFMNGSCYIGTRPYELLDTIGRLNPMFEGNQQQDAHEFMRCLLVYVQDASRSLNKYRKKAAGLSETSCKYVTEKKSLLASPKEVEMLGGLKESPKKDNAPLTAKVVSKVTPTLQTRSSKRLSGGNTVSKNENSTQDTKVSSTEVQTLKSPPTKRNSRGRKSLTELQNHTFSGQRSILDCYTVHNGGAKGDGKEEKVDSDGLTKEVKSEGEQVKVGRPPLKRLSNKRKAGETGTAGTQAETELTNSDADRHCVHDNEISGKIQDGEKQSNNKKRRFHSAEQETLGEQGCVKGEVITNSGLDNEREEKLKSNTSPLIGHAQGNGATVMPPSDQGMECGQGDAKFVVAQVQAKMAAGKKQTARKSMGAAKIDPSALKCEEDPSTKQAVVKLDKNGIAKYFNKTSKPQSLSDIERHLEPVSDSIEEIFQGQVALQTRCCECEAVTTRREEYQDISVAVRRKQQEEGEDSPERHTTPEDAFVWVKESLTEVERLEGDNKYWCDNCCHLAEAERSMHYSSVPEILTLHLKRFAMSQGSMGGFTKLTDHVPLPMLLPCIEDNCTQPLQHRMKLYGVIIHTGFTLSSGHYTAYIRAPEHSPALYDLDIVQPTISSQPLPPPPGDLQQADPNNNADDNNNCDAVVTETMQADDTQHWFECDDDVITVLTEHEFLTRLSLESNSTTTPYLLFYHRE